MKSKKYSSLYNTDIGRGTNVLRQVICFQFLVCSSWRIVQRQYYRIEKNKKELDIFQQLKTCPRIVVCNTEKKKKRKSTKMQLSHTHTSTSHTLDSSLSFPRLLANKMTTSVTLQMMERTQTFQWLGSPQKVQYRNVTAETIDYTIYLASQPPAICPHIVSVSLCSPLYIAQSLIILFFFLIIICLYNIDFMYYTTIYTLSPSETVQTSGLHGLYSTRWISMANQTIR